MLTFELKIWVSEWIKISEFHDFFRTDFKITNKFNAFINEIRRKSEKTKTFA